jgi:hypothetical protein
MATHAGDGNSRLPSRGGTDLTAEPAAGPIPLASDHRVLSIQSSAARPRLLHVRGLAARVPQEETIEYL